MEVKCSECGTVFEAARVTARFCSAKCKMRATRNATVDVPVESQQLKAEGVADLIEPVISSEELKPTARVKRECKRSNLCCTECVDFDSGVHWCPNKACGCWETKEEQLASLEAFQAACPHPVEESFMARCLVCGRPSFISHSPKKSE